MEKAVTVILAILICSAAHGESLRLIELRTQKDAAIKRVSDPVEVKYKVALQQLLKVLTASEDLETALEVKEEIKQPKKKFGKAC